MLFERKMANEMRAANDGRSDEFGRTHSRVITLGQLAHWLSMRQGSAQRMVQCLLRYWLWSDQPEKS